MTKVPASVDLMLNGAAPEHIFHVAHAHCLGAGCVCLCGAKCVSACSYHWARNHHVGFERVGCKLQPRSPSSCGSQQLGQMENSNAGMFSVYLAFFVSTVPNVLHAYFAVCFM